MLMEVCLVFGLESDCNIRACIKIQLLFEDKSYIMHSPSKVIGRLFFIYMSIGSMFIYYILLHETCMQTGIMLSMIFAVMWINQPMPWNGIYDLCLKTFKLQRSLFWDVKSVTKAAWVKCNWSQKQFSYYLNNWWWVPDNWTLMGVSPLRWSWPTLSLCESLGPHRMSEGTSRQSWCHMAPSIFNNGHPSWM